MSHLKRWGFFNHSFQQSHKVPYGLQAIHVIVKMNDEEHEKHLRVVLPPTTGEAQIHTHTAMNLTGWALGQSLSLSLSYLTGFLGGGRNTMHAASSSCGGGVGILMQQIKKHFSKSF